MNRTSEIQIMHLICRSLECNMKIHYHKFELYEFICEIKGIVHPKMKILSSCTHPQVVSNLYEFLCSAEHKGRYFEESL